MYSQSPLQTDFTPPPPSKSGLKLVCNVIIVYGNLQSENSQDCTQKPDPNEMYIFTTKQTTAGSSFLTLYHRRLDRTGRLC